MACSIFMDNVLEILIEKKIPFAILIGIMTLSEGMHMHIKEYYVIARRGDYRRLRAHKFKKGIWDILERPLNEQEIIWFKANTEEFNKVINKRGCGRVYELKSMPFRYLYKIDRYDRKKQSKPSGG